MDKDTYRMAKRTSIVRKVCRALLDLPKSLRRTPEPRLIMTLLVKNEQDLLEQNILFHRAMGVDAFIITDNNSTDATPSIIRKYEEKGWIAESIVETATDYSQKQWVDRMIWSAKMSHGATWVINADADEFWYSPTGSLKDMLRDTSANVLRCRVRNMYPEESLPWTQWSRTVRCIPDAEERGLSPYSIFGHDTVKVAHRAAGYLQISMGNHKVKMLPSRTAESDIMVYHFNIRGRRQFTEKMVNGGRQLEQRKSRHGGRHWRYFYEIYKQGRLDEEYDRVIGLHQQETLEREGYIITDNRLSKKFKKLGIG